MGRLIDADALLKHFEMIQEQENAIGLDFVAITDEIKEQPTAYDPDKVVEQLKAASYERYGNDGMGGELVVKLDDVVEITKGGRANV